MHVMQVRHGTRMTVCGARTHLEEATIRKEKQLTYREVLLGLDNSELGSDFKIYSVCEALRKCIRSV